jgi:hypothetical protein
VNANFGNFKSEINWKGEWAVEVEPRDLLAMVRRKTSSVCFDCERVMPLDEERRRGDSGSLMGWFTICLFARAFATHGVAFVDPSPRIREI